jgi:hypothetical protein
MGVSAFLSAVLIALSQAPSSECVDGPDSDQDGLSDACELTLAARFAPVLVVSEAACNWDPATARLGGGYLFGVHPRSDGVRLAYLPAYQMDCGWSGAKCMIRLRGGCDPHIADSEFIVVDIARSLPGGEWKATSIFLSAHCFGNNDGECRWFDRAEVEWFGDQPFVWVAEGKNANYRSRSACDSGHWHFDTCDRNDRSLRFPIQSSLQNIGSSGIPFPHHPTRDGCVPAAYIPLLPDSPGTECIWTGDAFRGWGEASVEGATPYRRYLEEVAGMVPVR